MTDFKEVAALEAVIASAAGVTRSVVTTTTVDGKEVLVAHVVTAPDAPVPPLRTTLEDRGLPLPRHLACWEALPMAFGEPSREMLDGAPIDGRCTGFGLDTEDKRAIARIWVDVLRPLSIGTGDSFLDLGGHSLLAIRMLAVVGKDFGVRVPVYEFLDDPTIAGLAQQVAARAGSAQVANQAEPA